MLALSLTSAFSEIVIALSAMAFLLVGAFRGNKSTEALINQSVIVLIIGMLLIALQRNDLPPVFNGLFVVDDFTKFMKQLLIFASILSLLLSINWLKREGIERFEYPVLILFSVLGMMMMISAHDMMALYVGIELQSLCLYVLASMQMRRERSSEAGLKYFVLGALSSGMLLYGISLVYGFTGTTDFALLAERVSGMPQVSIGLTVGLVFILAGMVFKLSAVPFHMWTPDVYQGAPTPVTAFFAVAPKLAAVALLARLLAEPLGHLVEQWQQILVFCAAASMIVGSFAALKQTNIKRLMAYSSIGHMGFILMGLAASGYQDEYGWIITEAGLRSAFIYIGIYIFMSIGTFAVIMTMRRGDQALEEINDLAGLSKNHPLMALAMTFFMFAMAGVPPLAGFFAKLYVLMAAVESGLYVLAVIGVLSSVVAAFYYLRLIKIMYFDEPTDAYDLPIDPELRGIIFVTAVITLLFFAFPGPLIRGAVLAAQALLA